MGFVKIDEKYTLHFMGIYVKGGIGNEEVLDGKR